MTGIMDKTFTPIPANAAGYDKLYALYKRLHDLFGTRDYAANQYTLMKDLLTIRDHSSSLG
jgi:L-ribulokinase